MLRQMLSKLIEGQKGQALPIVLVLLVLGGLVIAPTLRYASTSLKGHEVLERKGDELYAADSGIDYALFKLSNGETTINDYPLNGKTVSVNITDMDDGSYLITSTATSGGGSNTTIESYIEIIPGGNLDIFSGALASKGNISLGKDSNVTGDIYHGGTLTVGSGFTHIDGEIYPAEAEDFPTQAEDEAFAQALKDEALLGGTSPGLDISSDTSLGPLYVDGDVYVSGDIVLNLTGVVYITGSFTVKKDFTLRGTGSLITEGDIWLSKIADFGTDGDSIIMSLYGDITFKKGGIIEALVYAPNGTISFDKDATVIGGVVGAEIQADKEGSFTYIPSSSTIEYPGSLPSSLNIKSHTIN